VYDNTRAMPTQEVPFTPGRDVWWTEAVSKQPKEAAVEWVDAEHPLFLLYTSGSTGGQGWQVGRGRDDTPPCTGHCLSTTTKAEAVRTLHVPMCACFPVPGTGMKLRHDWDGGGKLTGAVESKTRVAV